MVINMQNYLMIQDNVVTNVCVWDGNTETWTPPVNATMLVQANTPALVWVYAGNDYELKEVLGQGQLSFTWNGTECVTNEPKPELPKDQPTTLGTQEL